MQWRTSMNALTLIVTSSRFLATSSARLNRNTCLSALAPYILSLSCSNMWPEIGLTVNAIEIVRPSFRMSVALVYALQKYFSPLDSNNTLVLISENVAKFWRGRHSGSVKHKQDIDVKYSRFRPVSWQWNERKLRGPIYEDFRQLLKTIIEVSSHCNADTTTFIHAMSKYKAKFHYAS